MHLHHTSDGYAHLSLSWTQGSMRKDPENKDILMQYELNTILTQFLSVVKMVKLTKIIQTSWIASTGQNGETSWFASTKQNTQTRKIG